MTKALFKTIEPFIEVLIYLLFGNTIGYLFILIGITEPLSSIYDRVFQDIETVGINFSKYFILLGLYYLIFNTVFILISGKTFTELIFSNKSSIGKLRLFFREVIKNILFLLPLYIANIVSLLQFKTINSSGILGILFIAYIIIFPVLNYLTIFSNEKESIIDIISKK